MTLSPPDWHEITRLTLDNYNQTAERFRNSTLDHDVSQNIAALLRHIQAQPPFQLLDFGCGPGRDLKAFTQMGHVAVGLDGSSQFVDMARASSGCEVLHQNFIDLNLPPEHFDGVYANASLFHVPLDCLDRVLVQLWQTLKSGGVLFSSNPRGNNLEGWNGPRYGAYHSLDAWRKHLQKAGFTELEHYYRPAGLPRDQQPWLASVWRKTA